MRLRMYLAVTAVGVATAVVSPSQTLAVEVLQDGGFEAANCAGTACNSPSWTESGTYTEGPSAASFYGPICDPIVCDPSGNPPEMTPRSGAKWFMFGAHTTADQFLDFGSVAQGLIPFPTGTATLRFYVRETDGRGTSSIRVTLDGAEVYSATSAPAEYSLVSIDVSAFTGAPRTLAISFAGNGAAGPASASDRWQMDDVSLDLVVADADGDGRADAVDSCPAVAGPGTTDGCPAIRRGLTLRYRGGAFRGTLTPAGPCAADQAVSVFKTRPGPDRREGSDRTDSSGRFVVGSPGRDGVYYAKALEVFDSAVGHCATARSRRRHLG